MPNLLNTLKQFDMKNLTISLVFILVSIAQVNGQTKKAFLEAATDAFSKKNYHAALVYYQEALAFNEEDQSMLYRVADAARLFHSYSLAEDHYQRVLTGEGEGSYPLASFYLAEMKQKLGKYDEAKTMYELYLSENESDDPFFTAKAQKEIIACEWASDLLENMNEDNTVEQLGDEVNTPYSEFGAIEMDEILYYSSMRFDNANDEYKPRRPVSKILRSEEGAEGEAIESQMLNPEIFTAHNTFSLDGTKLYYTVCEYKNDAEIRCDLFVRPISEDGSFGAATKLPEPVNAVGATNTQPNIGINPETGNEVLFFVSDREGGKGELDIWQVEIRGDEYGEPENLQGLNTSSSEITPFYHESTNTLYFSSRGYQSMGGFDIYQAFKSDDKWENPEHVAPPVNSSLDDVYFTLSEDGSTGYFSSNRIGSKYIDEENESCCYDVYKANLVPPHVDLLVLVFDAITNEEIEGATVDLLQTSTGESEQSMNPDGNDHHFKLDLGETFELKGRKGFLFSDTLQFTTEGIPADSQLVKKLYLKERKVWLDLCTFEAECTIPLNDTYVRIIDKNNKEVILDLQNPQHCLEKELIMGHEYEIFVHKEKYKSVTNHLNTGNYLGQNRIKLDICLDTLVPDDFLPLPLYFFNDLPDKYSRKTTTNKFYGDLFIEYFAMKESFKNSYAQGLTGEAAESAKAEIEKFFEDEVAHNYHIYNEFTNVLQEHLENGKKAHVRLKGYASPLAEEKYNEALSERRVNSVLNELFRYKNGLFKQYHDSGQLTITLEPYGEATAPSNISDNPNDIRNSIFGVKASRERRVELLPSYYRN